VVVDCYGQFFLGWILADDVLIQKLFNLERLGQPIRRGIGLIGAIILQDRVANGNALVADVGRGYSLGEEINFPTTSWLLWQNEHRNASSEPVRFTASLPGQPHYWSASSL